MKIKTQRDNWDNKRYCGKDGYSYWLTWAFSHSSSDLIASTDIAYIENKDILVDLTSMKTKEALPEDITIFFTTNIDS